MTYTDQLADEAIARWHLDPATKRVWKTRGSIPDKYFKEGGDYSPPVGSQHATDVMRMREIFALPEIAATKFQFGLRANDIMRGTARITEEEVVQFRTEVTQLRNKLRDGKDRNLFNAALKDTRIHPTKLVGASLYKKAIDDKRASMTDREKEEIRFAFLRLYNLIRP